VLVVVDGAAQIILLAVHLLALLRREPAAIRGAIVVDLAIQAGLRFSRFLVSPGSVARRKSLGDAPCWL